MTNKKISDLPAAAAFTGAELFEVVQAGGSYKGLLSAIGTYVGSFYLVKTNNLSDLSNISTARGNLGLGSLATQSGTFSGTSSGTNTGDQTSVTGNAGTATKLTTARAINGVAFDGSAPITVPAVDTATPRLAAANNLSDIANPATARTNLGAAASGANGDITSLTGLTTIPARIYAHPGFISGRYYWTNAAMALNNSTQLAINTIRFGLFYMPQSATISDLVTSIRTVSAGGNLQIAVYAENPSTATPTGSPLAVTGNISTAAVGPISADITGPNVTLPQGWYYAAINSDNSTAAAQGLNGGTNNQTGFAGTTTLANLNISGTQNVALSLALAQAFGTWPNLTSATFTEVNVMEPVIAIKIA